MKTEELIQLIDEAIEGSCSEADFLRLEAQLHVDAQARQLYYQGLQLVDALRVEASEFEQKEEAMEAQQVIPISGRTRTRNYQKIWLFGGAIATAASLSLGFLFDYSRPSSEGEQHLTVEEPVASGFGVLAESSQAIWEGIDLQRGALIPAGPLKLKSGLAKLELFSGVEVVLEGEAEFELQSAMAMTVHRGKLQADVPEPAHGFRVLTSAGEVVDLGTRFAMNVTTEHNDLQVLEGEVEWHPKAAQKENLFDGDKIRWAANGEKVVMPQDLNLFAKAMDFNQNRVARREAWEQSSATLKNDERLLVYFAIEPDTLRGRTLLDDSAQDRNGTIVRASRVPNRWGQSGRALDFSPTGSRVRLTIPGEHQSLTFYCWARIDSLDRHFNSLFLTDGHELNEPHWQIMDDGRLFFSVKKRDNKRPDKHIAYSPPIWTPAQSGQWMQLATVYNSVAGTTTHYLNGELVSEDKLTPELIVSEVKIGAASLGNWSEPYSQDPDFAVRNLNGAIDEFALFGVALSAAEIKSLFESGKP